MDGSAATVVVALFLGVSYCSIKVLVCFLLSVLYDQKIPAQDSGAVWLVVIGRAHSRKNKCPATDKKQAARSTSGCPTQQRASAE